MSQKKTVTMEALRKRMPVIDPELAEAAWDALENIEPGLVKRVNREDLAALMMDYMVRVAIDRSENTIPTCTFRAAWTAAWKRWKSRLTELRRRFAMAGMVLWTGGVS